MAEKYNRKDSTHLRVEPDVAGRIRFYKMALRRQGVRNMSQTLNLIMDVFQEHINEISKQNSTCPTYKPMIPSLSLTNYANNTKNNEKANVEAV